MWINLSGEILFEPTEGITYERGSLYAHPVFFPIHNRYAPHLADSTNKAEKPHFAAYNFTPVSDIHRNIHVIEDSLTGGIISEVDHSHLYGG
jgi:hypothetical protein